MEPPTLHNKQLPQMIHEVSCLFGNSSSLPGKQPEIGSSCPGAALPCKQPLETHHFWKPGYVRSGLQKGREWPPGPQLMGWRRGPGYAKSGLWKGRERPPGSQLRGWRRGNWEAGEPLALGLGPVRVGNGGRGTYFASPAPGPCNYQFILCICESISALFVSFVFQIPHIGKNVQQLCFSI